MTSRRELAADNERLRAEVQRLKRQGIYAQIGTEIGREVEEAISTASSEIIPGHLASSDPISVAFEKAINGGFATEFASRLTRTPPEQTLAVLSLLLPKEEIIDLFADRLRQPTGDALLRALGGTSLQALLELHTSIAGEDETAAITRKILEENILIFKDNLTTDELKEYIGKVGSLPFDKIQTGAQLEIELVENGVARKRKNAKAQRTIHGTMTIIDNVKVLQISDDTMSAADPYAHHSSRYGLLEDNMIIRLGTAPKVDGKVRFIPRILPNCVLAYTSTLTEDTRPAQLSHEVLRVSVYDPEKKGYTPLLESVTPE